MESTQGGSVGAPGFTPGRWHVTDAGHVVGGGGLRAVVVGRGEAEDVESVRAAYQTGFPEADGPGASAGANARLMAAAPELYAACKAAAEHFESTDAPLGAVLRAAIAKAEGRGAP